MTVDPADIMSGGPPKDGIPAIDDPRFIAVSEATNLSAIESVIGLTIGDDAGDDARAYPLSVLIWHEIANDTVDGVPVAVTYRPLCNAAIVFDRRLGDRVLDFGTTGKLRNSDLVMYDRQTQSWWRQFTGEGIAGALAGETLTMPPARLESVAEFRARAPRGRVLVPNDPGFRSYGANPYVGCDRSAVPFLFRGEPPPGMAPMERVVAVGREAWTLDLLKRDRRVEHGDLTIAWTPGQNSALDTRAIAQGRDVGTVTVQRRGRDAPYHVTFAFVFHAFEEQGVAHGADGTIRWNR